MDLPEALFRLDNLEDALLAQIQELRAVRAELERHTVNGSLEPLLSAEQVSQILGVDVGHVHAQARSRNTSHKGLTPGTRTQRSTANLQRSNACTTLQSRLRKFTASHTSQCWKRIMSGKYISRIPSLSRLGMPFEITSSPCSRSLILPAGGSKKSLISSGIRLI